MSINELSISFPDFKLLETINPEQFDTNNSEIVTKINAVITAFNGTNDTDIPLLDSRVTDLETRMTAEEGALVTHKTSADHDARYYTEVELDAGQLDNRYHTETELSGGALDTRYYTKQQVDTKSFSTSNLTDGSVTTPKIALGAVGTPQLANQAVTADKIHPTLLENVAITTHRNATEIDHPDGSVTTRKILDLGVTTEKLGAESVTFDKLGLDTVEYIDGVGITDAERTRWDSAEQNAKDFSLNRQSIGSFSRPNLVKNPTFQFGLSNWVKGGNTATWVTFSSTDTVAYAGVSEAIPAGSYSWVESTPIAVSPGSPYTLSALFHSMGVTNTASGIWIEVKNYANMSASAIGTLYTDLNKWWHLKSTTLTIPAGVTQISLRLVVGGATALPNTDKAFAQIKLEIGSNATSFNRNMDFQYSNDGKIALRDAIVGKGGTVADADGDGLPSFAELTNGVNALSLSNNANGIAKSISQTQYTVRGLTFMPKRVTITNSTHVVTASSDGSLNNVIGGLTGTVSLTTYADGFTVTLSNASYSFNNANDMKWSAGG